MTDLTNTDTQCIVPMELKPARRGIPHMQMMTFGAYCRYYATVPELMPWDKRQARLAAMCGGMLDGLTEVEVVRIHNRKARGDVNYPVGESPWERTAARTRQRARNRQMFLMALTMAVIGVGMLWIKLGM